MLQLDASAQIEWQRLRAEHDRLDAEFRQLKGQEPPDRAAVHRLRHQLAVHLRQVSDWRRRILQRG